MRIKSVRIQNFRSFADQTVDFNRYTCLVGPNGAGKSNVLQALNVFFRETRDVATNSLVLTEQDFHNKNTANPIRITVTFTDLSPKAQDDFKHYCRQGELVVTAEAIYRPESKSAPVEQHGERLAMAEFKEYFEALGSGALVAKLKEIYGQLRQNWPDLPAPATKDAMTGALNAYEAAHPQQCALLPSPAQFYGFSKGSNLLRDHLEWIYVPAVKDVTTEQLEGKSNSFGRLVARAVRSKVQFADDLKGIRTAAQDSYKKLLESSTSALEELSKSLQARVAQWAHPAARVQLSWDENEDRSVSIQEPLVRILAGEGTFTGELARFGQGLQRCYLLALLHELSGATPAVGPTLILACEEPELFQHPPQARHLASVLMTLSRNGAQVMVSTHSPLFVAGEVFEDVRLVRKSDQSGQSSVHVARYEAVAKRIAAATGKKCQQREGMTAIMHRALQPAVNEIFFATRVVLVEGIEDMAYISSYLHLLGSWDDFRRRGQHLVCTNGKSALLEPLTILMELGISAFVIFDGDDCDEQKKWRDRHEADNLALLRALGVEKPAAFTASPLWGAQFVQWPDCLSVLVQAEMGTDLWQQCSQVADAEWGYAGSLQKNPLHVGTTLRLAWDKGARSGTLNQLCQRLVQ